MSKLAAAIAGSLSGLLLLSSCGSREAEATANAAVAADENAAGDPSSPAPVEPAAVDNTAEPVPPPDAVSHPNGYLPPAPAEPDAPGANSSATDKSPPATEDQYIRNGQ